MTESIPEAALPALDEQTLYAFADLICDDHGPTYRTGSMLATFFRNAGLTVPAFEGTRGRWVIDRLQELTSEPGALEKVVRRAANPREYGGDADKTNYVLARLNEILALDGIKVELDGVQPRLRAARPRLTTKQATPGPQAIAAPPDFGRITDDGSLQSVLSTRWNEAQQCMVAGAYLSAVVMMGSLLEGALVARLRSQPEEAMRSASAPRGQGRARPISEWTLAQMIIVAHERGWIERDVRDFSVSLRDYRNLVHPAEQAKQGFYPDRDTCGICWLTVQAALNDLAR